MSRPQRPQPPVVILAAGNGHRLVTPEMAIPKPLCQLGEMTLLDRALDTFTRCGFSRVVIVTGYLADMIEDHLQGSAWPADIELAHNPQFDADNGLSVLASAPHIGESFVLTMADHVLDPQMVRRIFQAGREPDEIVLAVDAKHQEVFDLDEATKVQLDGDRVVRVGKALTRFDAVDTGLFYAGPPLMEALILCRDQGLTKLADGVNLLARDGRVRAVDIGPARWVDVDTPQAMAEAEQWLASPQPPLAKA